MADDERLTALARDRGPGLVGYAFLLTGSVVDAEDLVQEALVRTFSRRTRGQDVEHLEAYVRRAILHLHLDGHRRRSRWGRTAHLHADLGEAGAPDAAAAVRLDVHAALTSLSPRQRACVVLHYVDDLPVAEVAEALGISPGAVKRYLSDARAALGPLLADDDDTTTVIPRRSR